MSTRKTAPLPRTSRLRDNILATYAGATDSEREHGADWYREAHQLAVDLSERHGITVERAAGVIAVLSPLQSWTRNVADAVRVFETGHYVGLTDKRVKVARLLSGEDVNSVVSGPKVTSFYRNILDPSGDDVTIDRHAHDIADGKRRTENQRAKAPGLTGMRYARYVDAYRAAARELNIGALELQAIVWVAWRREHGITA